MFIALVTDAEARQDVPEAVVEESRNMATLFSETVESTDERLSNTRMLLSQLELHEDRDSWLPAIEVAFESLKACSEAVYDVWAIQREAVEATVAAYSAVVATRTGDSVTTAVGAHRAHLATHPILMETMDAWTGAYEAFSAASESQTEEQVISNAQSVEVHRLAAEAALDRIRSAQD